MLEAMTTSVEADDEGLTSCAAAVVEATGADVIRKPCESNDFAPVAAAGATVTTVGNPC